MKKFLLLIAFCFTFLTLSSGDSTAQYLQRSANARAVSAPLFGNSERQSPSKSVYDGLHSTPMSAMTLPLPSNVDVVPVSTTFPFQSDGRPLHNIQIDPDNPMNIHAVFTSALDNSEADTSALLTRRVFYTFSSDGGKNWKTPVTFSTVRSGYADLQLFKRNGKYVPVIAAHRVTATAAASILPGIWIEKGDPGTGNFAECLANRTAGDGSQRDIGWPTIALSPHGDTAYMVASIVAPSNASLNLQFGIFVLGPNKDTAKFTKWSEDPGNADQNLPSAALARSGGSIRVRVSPTGKVGVLWANADLATPDESLYFVESKDGGKTWPSILNGASPLTAVWASPQTAGDSRLSGAQLAPTEDVDFWYDGEVPKFFFTIAATQLTSLRYYPSTTTPVYLDLVANDTAIPVSFYLLAAKDTHNFTVSSILGTHANFQFPVMSWATVARTSDPNNFAIFYETYLPDTEILGSDAGDTMVYASIFYQATSDGGKSWTQPAAVLTNSGTGQKFDYRQPMTSDFNPIVSGTPVYHVAAMVDTAAGLVTPNGLPGWDLMTAVHATVRPSFDAVRYPQYPVGLDLAQNYPNPVNGKTTISYTLREGANVVLTVEDMLGRPVATLVNAHNGAGDHSALFEPGNLPSGIYRYTLHVGSESITKSMSILK